MLAEPQTEHHWLQQLVGEWTSESECGLGPGQQPQKFTGTQRNRSLGGLWVIFEGECEMPAGGMSYMIITLGYDPAQRKYVGTFVGSVMTNLWIYAGTLDCAGKVLTLDTEGPSFSGDGSLAKYQDIIEIHSPDHHTLSSQVLGDNGQWTRFMTAHYRRTHAFS